MRKDKVTYIASFILVKNLHDNYEKRSNKIEKLVSDYERVKEANEVAIYTHYPIIDK